jgi:hypothetical protein
MPELTLAERLLYSTVKLTAYKAGVAFATGTGFFMCFSVSGQKILPAIITNKHVVAGADQITAMCHIANGDKPSGKIVQCRIPIVPGFCADHPDEDVDLCAIPFGDIMNRGEAAGTPIFIQSLDESLIPSDDEWQYFDAIESIIMVGCPNGIHDELNNIPIVRRGITATPLSKKYNGKDEFMVDIACFPGSSGSPILVYDLTGFLDRRTNLYQLGRQRIKLVGILYAGPQIANNGQIVLGKPPRVTVDAMMHLGNAIRSSALRSIETVALQKLTAAPKPPLNIGMGYGQAPLTPPKPA